MKSEFLTVILAILGMVTGTGFVIGQKNLVKIQVEEQPFCDFGYYKLVFEDEFTGQNLDTGKWFTYFPYGENSKKILVHFAGHMVGPMYTKMKTV